MFYLYIDAWREHNVISGALIDVYISCNVSANSWERDADIKNVKQPVQDNIHNGFKILTKHTLVK